MPETFLQTDIVGSTRLWQEQPDAMAVDLERHDQCLRHVIEGTGGNVFKHTGDGILAHFSDIEPALESGRRIQEELSHIGWNVTAGIAVRVAVFAGEALPRAGDFFGPALNALARLVELPSGGQSLYATTAPLEREDLLPIGFLPLTEGGGRFHIYQIVREGEPVFSPLRVSNLPPRQASFVGRRAELDALDAAAKFSRIVSLVGLGGSGKTQIALEWLNYAKGEIVWVPLAGIEPGASLHAAVWRAVEGEVPEPPHLVNALTKIFASRPIWIALDNAEHVLEGVADFVEAHTDHVRFLITSREPLALIGEQIVRVGPMNLEEGKKLFTARAHAAAGRRIDEGSQAIVERIVQRLEGVPLAIELAASRLRSMSLSDLESRLSDRFQTLASNQRGRPDRHLTLEKTLDWSYDLLSERERELLHAVGLVPAPFQTEMIVGWWADEALEEDLASLVDKSWVLLEPAARPYRMLETVREYVAIKRAEVGSEPLLKALHSEWALAEARRLRKLLAGAEAEEATREISLLAPQFKFASKTFLETGLPDAAAETLRILWRFGYRLGRVRETLRDLGPLWKSLPEGASSPEVLDALRSYGWALYLSGEIAEAEEPARKALARAIEVRSPYDESQARNLLAGVLSANGQHTEAMVEYQRALEGIVGDEHDLARARIETNVGATALLVGEYEEALRVLNRAERVIRAAEDAWATAWILLTQAQALRCLGRRETALSKLMESLEIRTRLGDDRGVAYAHLGLSQWHLDVDDLGEARTHFREGARRALKIEDPWAIDAALFVLARLRVMQDGEKSPLTQSVLRFVADNSDRVRFARTAEDRAFLHQHPPSPGAPGVSLSAEDLLRDQVDFLNG